MQLHLQFVLITEDGSTKSNYDAWLIGRLLHLFFPSQFGFAEAIAHQSQTGLRGRKITTFGTKRNFNNDGKIKRVGLYSI